jgi:hypothetical protein
MQNEFIFSLARRVSSDRIVSAQPDFNVRIKPVFHFNRIVTYRSIFFCVEVINSTLPLRKQRNTLRFGTIEVENWLKSQYGDA